MRLVKPSDHEMDRYKMNCTVDSVYYHGNDSTAQLSCATVILRIVFDDAIELGMWMTFTSSSN